MTIRSAGHLLRTRQISCVELVEESARTIERREPEVNAFITITLETARAEARELDAELAQGKDRGPLHGIPIAHKDLFYTAGVPTTNGSLIFRDFVPAYDATVVKRLREAGAISMGKLNMHELAYGITSSNPHYGPVHNPSGLEHIPGGSSGGSGAAVAADMVFLGMGSDTGGSIRVPGAYCGVVGLKPTYGRVSRHGCFPLGFSLDHMGPLTRTVEDTALVLEAIAGPDPNDASAADKPFTAAPQYPTDLNGVRLACAQNFYYECIDDEACSFTRNAVRLAGDLGAEVAHIDVPDPEGLNTVARTILLAEASAAMAPHLERRSEFGGDIQTLLDTGRMLLATDYINAQRVREQFRRRWRAVFEHHDVVLTPATPNTAPKIGDTVATIGGKQEDVRIASTRFVRGINALGFPAIVIPSGRAKNGLPLAIQLIAAPWREDVLLRTAAALENAIAFK